MRKNSMTALVAGLLASGGAFAQTAPASTSTQPVPGPNTAQATTPGSTTTQPVLGPATAQATPPANTGPQPLPGSGTVPAPPAGTSTGPIPDRVPGGSRPTAAPAQRLAGGAASPSAAAPGQRSGRAHDINPSSMPWGSRAGDAPGMQPRNNTPGATAQEVNPSPMPWGSRAGDAPGMMPGPRPQLGGAPAAAGIAPDASALMPRSGSFASPPASAPATGAPTR